MKTATMTKAKVTLSIIYWVEGFDPVTGEWIRLVNRDHDRRGDAIRDASNLAANDGERCRVVAVETHQMYIFEPTES